VLKINLLPPYIYEKRKVRRAALVFGVLFVAVVAGMLAWGVSLSNKTRQLTMQVNDMEQKANEVRQLEAQVQAELARIPPVKAKVAFIEGLMEYNLKVPKVYEELAKFTYSRVLYRSVLPSGTGLSITAHARSVGDCGRYLLNMYRASHVFSSVSIDSVPGWPAGGEGAAPVSMAGGFDFAVTCVLVQPITAPMYGVAEATVPGAPPPMPAETGAPAPGTSAAEGP